MTETMLKRMEDNRIFYVTKRSDYSQAEHIPDDHPGQFVIEECCDLYFRDVLTADELRQLGRELIAIADG
jgi:hypothetical protein